MSRSTPAYIFDIDGTLANLQHRRHFIAQEPKDWDRFYDIDTILKDRPYSHIVRLVRTLHYAGEAVVFCTGRPERLRLPTVKWLYYHVIGDPCKTSWLSERLYMRPDEMADHGPDHREDYIVKRELLRKIVWDGFTPIMAFDDRQQVVDMWRAEGIPCAQVAEGEF